MTNQTKQPEIQLPKTAQEVAETLADGTQIQVTLGDQPAIVKVRRCPRKDFPLYAAAVTESMVNEESECAFYLGWSVDETRELSDESFEAVMQEGRRINFSRFSAWFARRRDLIKLANVQTKDMEALAEKLTASQKRTSS